MLNTIFALHFPIVSGVSSSVGWVDINLFFGCQIHCERSFFSILHVDFSSLLFFIFVVTTFRWKPKWNRHGTTTFVFHRPYSVSLTFTWTPIVVLIGWLADWLIYWLIEWLIDWISVQVELIMTLLSNYHYSIYMVSNVLAGKVFITYYDYQQPMILNFEKNILSSSLFLHCNFFRFFFVNNMILKTSCWSFK